MKRLLRRIAQLPLIDDYYDTLDYQFIDIGVQTVEVNKIIGLLSSRVDEYNDDWTPKDENDSRWLRLKELVDAGKPLPDIPLIKTPDDTYFPDGDGNHRISVAKVMGLQTVQARVTAMVPGDLEIEEQWQEHAKDKINKLNELSNEYKEKRKLHDELHLEAFDTKDYSKFEQYNREMDQLNDKISQLDEEIREEEQIFKKELLS